MYWSPGQSEYRSFDPKIIEEIYYNELVPAAPGGSRIIMLELSSYLECYLWRNFDPTTCTYAHVMSIIYMLNEKFRENLMGVWSALVDLRDEAALEAFFKLVHSMYPLFEVTSSSALKPSQLAETVLKELPDRLCTKAPHGYITAAERTQYVLLYTSTLASLEHPILRRAVAGLVSLPIWRALNPSTVDAQLLIYPELANKWKKLVKMAEQGGAADKFKVEADFLPSFVRTFFQVLLRVGHSIIAIRSGADTIEGICRLYSYGSSSSAKKAKQVSPAVEYKEDQASGQEQEDRDAREGDSEDISASSARSTQRKGRDSRAHRKSTKQKQEQHTKESDPFSEFRSSWASKAKSKAVYGFDLLSEIRGDITYLERALELFTDLLAQLPTRRFAKPLFTDVHFIVRTQLSAFANYPSGPSSASLSNAGQSILPTAQRESNANLVSDESSSSESESESESGSDDEAESRLTESDPEARIPADLDLDDMDGSSSSDSDSDTDSDTDSENSSSDTGSESEEEPDEANADSKMGAGKQQSRKSPATKKASSQTAKGAKTIKPSQMRRCSNRLFNQLLQQFETYLAFEVDDKTGITLSQRELAVEHLYRIQLLQRTAFKLFKSTLNELILAMSKSLATKQSLIRHFDMLSTDELIQFADALNVSFTASNTAFDGLNHLLLGSAALREDSSIHQPADAPIFREFALAALAQAFAKPQSSAEAIQALPLYPTEQHLWDENVVPTNRYRGKTCLALPKLNIQFLSAYDYLLRCFTLYRMESAYEIREELVDTLVRMNPQRISSPTHSDNAYVQFFGRSQLGTPIRSFVLKGVKPPALGSSVPQQVRGEVTIDLSLVPTPARVEWEGIREHDILFLVTLLPPAQASDDSTNDNAGLGSKRGRGHGNQPLSLAQKLKHASSRAKVKALGIKRVRGCEVVCVLDEKQQVVGERDPDTGKVNSGYGNLRTFVVNLDCAQYHLDMQQLVTESEQALASEDSMADLYASFNVVVRRRGEEKSFKGLLQTVRDIMLDSMTVPTWLQEVFLGFGDPSSATYQALSNRLTSIKFADTFVSREHLLDSFPDSVKVIFETPDEDIPQGIPESYEITFPDNYGATKFKELHEKLQRLLPKYRGQPNFATSPGAPVPLMDTSNTPDAQASSMPASESSDDDPERPVVRVKPYPRVQMRDTVPKRNAVRFTPMQIEAIKSGVNPGLTLIVGPPGTGKTDTAVQILAELYHNFPNERIVLVTHSNHALNDLFIKLMQRDVDERYLLRLGHAGSELETEQDFSKFGRVNHMLQRRLELLEQVNLLGKSLNVVGDVGATCETAGIFKMEHINELISSFRQGLQAARKEGEDKAWEFIKSKFPFERFFSNCNTPSGDADEAAMEPKLFTGATFKDDLATVESCLAKVEQIFKHLEETRPFELLRTFKDRGDFLVAQHAKVIAMTCAYAAMRRSNFLELGFQYDTLVMEEAAQALDIETFIPMTLQANDKEFGNRLKRVVLLGDHNQLPPIVQNRALQQYARLEQSLFARFMRLGFPAIHLNAQGRMRPELAQLWNWRYESLLDLPLTLTDERFARANCGMAHEYQVVDLGEESVESCPQPYFYQNLGEAEFLVHTYMYMRLMGIPAARISILTTYNGQRALLQDVLNKRCAQHPLLGLPAHVSTVDKFQGQQNDYVLLSLVRTQTVGHIRDIRRLVVALSRARLGLYVFCRAQLFQNAFELARSFALLMRNPTKLQLCPSERNLYGVTLRPSAGQCIAQGLPPDAFLRAAGAMTDSATTAVANTEGESAPGVDLRVPVFTIENLHHLGVVVDRLRRAAEEEYRLNYEMYRKIEEEVEREKQEKARRTEEARQREREMLAADEEEARRELERERALEAITRQYEAELEAATADYDSKHTRGGASAAAAEAK